MHHPTYIEINVSALRTNVSRVRAYAAKQTKILAILKANAYGHGLIKVAQHLGSLVDGFGISCLEEAVALRKARISQRIVLLEGFFSETEWKLLGDYYLDTVVHNVEQLNQLTSSPLDRKIIVWLKINTGLNRLGFPIHQAEVIWQTLKACPWVQDIYLMTHFANADLLDRTTTLEQLAAFSTVTKTIEAEHSLANSAAILAWPQTHADWVRPGLMLYGVSPFPHTSGADYGLLPVMTLKSTIIAIQYLKQGDTVGYHGNWVVKTPTGRIGIIALGYSDGYSRNPVLVPVLVKGRLAYSVGCVSMNMSIIDLNDHPEVCVGDFVTLWGEGLPIEQVAKCMGRSPNELLCCIYRKEALRIQVKEI